MKSISLIVSVEKDWGIGYNGKLCLSVPGDLRYFKGRTMGSNVIMGRKTYDSIGHPLSGRTNVILTSDKTLTVPEEMVLNSLGDVVDYIYKAEKDVFVIGGAKVYEQLLPYCEFAYVTENDIAVKHDVSFPLRLDKSDGWQLIDKIKNTACTEFDSYFCIYRRVGQSYKQAFDLCESLKGGTLV